ncbi:MAG: hypothetical protein EBT15_06915 [Betaproteobacteria bacterium]|nr:hypothetical protein [Betaproteobacteria bacterium]
MSEETNVEPGSSGLLDEVSVEDSKQTEKPESTAINHLAAEPAVKETGPAERPEWLPENFWKDGQADFENMAKSWKDLRAKISKGEHNAPADGKYKLDALGDENSPIASTLTSWAKDNGLSQAQFDDLAGKLVAQSREVSAVDAIDPAAEMKALGPNANAVINGMVDWARGLVSKGIWGKDDFEEFKIMGGTARGLTALMKVREAYEGRIPLQSTPLEGMPSREELDQMVADPRYKTDAAYRKKVERLFEQAYAD